MFSPLLPFSEYIKRCRAMIATRRTDLLDKGANIELILNTNSPFELTPSTRPTHGALLIHGLLNSPFALHDVGVSLQQNGMLVRSILLPGHGTHPSDLLDVSYEDWIEAVRYGIATLRQEVEHVFLVGYSTGAALAVHEALLDHDIAGLILLAPAFKIKAPVDLMVNWKRLTKFFTTHKKWVCETEEIDYAKYQSIPFNAVIQVSKLTGLIEKLATDHALPCPMFMSISHEDETVSCKDAIDFFKSQSHPNSQLLLYSANKKKFNDPRIHIRLTENSDMNIKNFSHLSVLTAPSNPHYGVNGDYVYASSNQEDVLYGAYNSVELDAYRLLYDLGITKFKRLELTYNPDFDFMAKQISLFINKEAC